MFCRYGVAAVKIGGVNLQHAGFGIQFYPVAVAQAGDGATVEGFRRQVYSRRYLTRGAGHAPVGHQRHLEAPVLQYAQHRGQLVQLRHAVSPRSLEAHHRDKVPVQFAGVKADLEFILVREDHHRCLDPAMFGLYRRDFDHRPAEIALQ